MRPCSKLSALLVTPLVEKISRSLNSYDLIIRYQRSAISYYSTATKRRSSDER